MAVNNMLKALAATGQVVASSAYTQEPIAGAGIQVTPMSIHQRLAGDAEQRGKRWQKLAATQR